MKTLPTLLASLLFFPSALTGQASDLSATNAPSIKSSFIHIGSNKFADALQNTPVVQAGLPIMKLFSQYAYNGIYAGGTSWSRGEYVASGIQAGDLLNKSSYWLGAYWGTETWTAGLGPEYSTLKLYQKPAYANDFYSSRTEKKFGASAFVSFHWTNGFGAFLRAGSESGIGGGISINF